MFFLVFSNLTKLNVKDFQIQMNSLKDYHIVSEIGFINFLSVLVSLK